MVMTSFAHDYIEKLVFGGFNLLSIWLLVHLHFRDRVTKHLIPWAGTVCGLMLIHLPPIPGVIVYDGGPLAAQSSPVVVMIDPCSTLPRSTFCPPLVPLPPVRRFWTASQEIIQ